MTKLDKIRVALEGHLDGIKAQLPFIAWPDVQYVRKTGTPYIRVEFLPMLRRPVTAGPSPDQRRSGVFLLTVFSPELQGSRDRILTAEKLEARFEGSTSIVNSDVSVRISYSEAKSPIPDPPFTATPVEIGWYTYSR